MAEGPAAAGAGPAPVDGEPYQVQTLGEAFGSPDPGVIELPGGAGDPDGDEALVGGALSPKLTPNEVALVQAAINPVGEGWDRIQQAITSGEISTEHTKAVLGGVLRGLARWGLPNLKDFIDKEFDVGSGAKISVDIDEQGEFGETALMEAAVNGREKSVRLLLQKGANPNVQNKDGETALMWAAAYDEIRIIDVLLIEGAKPNLVDTLGWNALMVAAWTGNYLATIALKYESNKKATNKEGQTAANLAAVDGSPAKQMGQQLRIIELLEGPEPGTRIKKKGGTLRRKKTKSKKRGTR